MDKLKRIEDKIISLEEARKRRATYQLKSQITVFTNGCFDILHAGHIHSLMGAANEGHKLIVGLNSDASVKRLKGNDRPINSEQNRALLLATMAFVDMVVIFEEDTPLQLIQVLQPEVLVKGGDYAIENIVGADEVIKNGGRVVTIPLVAGESTTGIIQKIQT